jgi:hypothetical protein
MPRRRSQAGSAGLDIIAFCTDPALLNLKLSPAQRTLLKSIYNLPLTSDELEIFQLCTGRSTYPTHAFAEVTVVAGARSGKDSRIAAPVVCYEALFGGHDKRLAKGELGTIPLVAQDREATRVAFAYVKSYLTGSPHLAAEIEDDILTTELNLKNGLRIACFPSSQRSLRSWSIPVAVLDELAFYRVEGGSNSDVEIQSSIRRGMINFGEHTRLVKISTPFAKDGVLFDDFEKAFAKDDPDLLVWRASTALMNPSIKGARLDRERRLDPTRYAREYEAIFEDDSQAFLPLEWISAAVVAGRFELPPMPGVIYAAGVDPSGGGSDAFTFSIAHPEINEAGSIVIVQDLLRGQARTKAKIVDLEAVVKEYADICKQYGIPEVIGDRYAAGWSKQAFERCGIKYIDAPEKSTLYTSIEPLFATGAIALLDHATQARELQILERKARAGGKVVVDHPRGSHDDFANALALSVCAAHDLATGTPIETRPNMDELFSLAHVFPTIDFDFSEIDLSD